MLNKTLEREIEKCLPKPIYFIWSEEALFLEEVLAKAVTLLIASNLKDFNYDVFYPGADPHEVLDTATTLPLMAPRRLVVLKDFHQFPEAHIKAMIPYFKKPCESTCMLILSQKEPKAVIDLPIFPIKIKEYDIPQWVRQKAHEKGVRMTDSAVEHLIESVGTDIGLLHMEIEKLALSGLQSIDDKDIASLTGVMRDYTAFNLIDSIITGNKAKAFRILKILFQGRSSDVTSILGALNWHYRQFYALWKGRGKRPPKMRDTTYKTLLKYLPSYTEVDFYYTFQNLHEADVGIKTSGRPELTLEMLLIKLLEPKARN